MSHWEGLEEMVGELDAMQGAVENTTDIGLRKTAELIKTDISIARPGKGVPKEDGILIDSLTVKGPTNDRVELSAGGASAPYALAQHERLDYSHDLGEAKYLTRGWRRFQRHGARAVQKAMIEQAIALAFVNPTIRAASFDTVSPAVA